MKKYLVLIAIIFTIIIFQNLTAESPDSELQILRPDYDSETGIIDINAVIDGEKIPVSINLEPVELNPQAALELFQKAVDKIRKEIPKNTSSDLNLPGQTDGIDIFWLSSDEKLIAPDGKVNPYELEIGQEREVNLTAVLSLGEYRFEYDFEIKVQCPDIDTIEKKTLWINSRIKKYLEDNTDKQHLTLPENIEGINVRYELQSDNNPALIVIGFLGVAAIFLARRLDIKNKEKIKMRQLEIDYCEVVSKLVLLMGAGLTIRNAWEKTVADYQAQKKVSGERIVYEEMAVTLNEMASGVPERMVYENFGKRCKLPRYIKLGSLLQQNFVKGSKQLLSLLETESDIAFEERKLLAKKQGEEAGTKLLLPMVLELVVVMAIVMVPALMSF